VALKGLVECPNLRAVAGPSVDELKGNCSNWWLGRVEAYWHKDSEDKIVPARFTNSAVEEVSTALREQQKSRRDKIRQKKKARQASQSPGSSSDEKSDELDEDDSSSEDQGESDQDVELEEAPGRKGKGGGAAERPVITNTSKRGRSAKSKGIDGKGKNGTDARGKRKEDPWKLEGKTIEWVEVCWYGQIGEAQRKATCFDDVPMEALIKSPDGSTQPQAVTDKVPRRHLCFEEEAPGQVRFTLRKILYKPSANLMRDHAPNPHINQAGVSVDSVYDGCSGTVPGMEESLEATLSEIKGFSWSVIDKTLPEEVQAESAVVYTVKGIYCWAGELFASVEMDGMTVQHDHLVEEIRERRYFEAVDRRLALPEYIRWSSISTSMFSVDFSVIRDNVECYFGSIR